MSKGIAIKFIIIFLVLAGIHSIFWFFKTGQIEKQVNNLISENSSNISVTEVKVSGFPLKQTVTIKDLKFTPSQVAFSKYQITIKKLIATSGIFNNNFVTTIADQISVLDNDSSISSLVEFSKEPEIELVVSDNMIKKFSYQDFGHRVLSSEKNVIYASSATKVSFESATEEGDKVRTKISINLKDIEGFDILSIYKNAFEKKVIEGIKTGEITIGNSSLITAPTTEAKAAITINQNSALDQAIVAPTSEATPIPTTAVTQTTPTAPEDAAVTLSNNLVKSNFIIDAEYLLTPSQNSEQQTDPTQIQETPIQYSKTLKISNLEFSNPLYKIMINGQIDTFQDDSYPSGSITVKIEKIDSLLNQITAGLGQIVEQKKPVLDVVKSADLNSENVIPNPTFDKAAQAPNPAIPAVPLTADDINKSATTTPLLDDSYQIFLKRFAANLSQISKEVSLKNQLSKDDLSVFDIRREKNLDFLINETPTREILGKF